ncbi:MAG: peptidase S41, partial [Firmicutes bacterium]|nr:peptidase S41 [Bacillota bacterium]
VLWQFKRRITKNRPFEDLLFTGRLFALTSTNTFSSAAMFAVTLLDNNLAEIIGEIPGNMPSSYGDILTFQTPNAKLLFTISFKYFDRIDGTKADLPLIPHYEVKAADAIDKLYEIIE